MAPLVAILACRSAVEVAVPPGDPARPDIVLISIDSLRPDHLGAYGYARATSPVLDGLANAGLRFSNARSASPWTLPAHLTMLTGMWPVEHEVVEDSLTLSASVPMVQERLAADGWATAGLSSTIYVSGGFGFSRGFSVWDDHGVTERDNLKHPVRMNQVVDEALSWLGGLPQNRPAFLFLHTYDVHYPYRPPAPWDAKFDPPATDKETHYRSYAWYKDNPLDRAALDRQIAQYDESIAWVDSEIGRLLAGWKRPVVVIVTADHGEEFGERGSWGHAHMLHPEALDIPMVIAGPGIGPGVRNDAVGTVDIANTVAALAGVASLGGDGVDLRGVVPERSFWEETSRFKTRRLGVSQEQWRLELEPGRARLYDTVTDPGELDNLATTRPEVVDRLRSAIAAKIGVQWEVTGAVTSDGFLTQGGGVVRRASDGAFGLWPPHSQLVHDGVAVPAILRPTAGPLRFQGTARSESLELGQEVRDQLEALGYVQGAEGGK